MSSIYVLIPIAMIFVAVAIMVFFWAVKSNQYDDLDREGTNILFDEDLPAPQSKASPKNKQKTTQPDNLND
ncbi:cbb3-type cytochrome oxidase assembly protein CcoS [Psychromonas sp.]|uniref:cbb3-type cytochrome oxidase assembly protein CcoS n=1 Tax=Psychromonas sp. TaxID=1884585 RepID=UPI0035614F58